MAELRDVFEVLNRMASSGVIESYAIGGAFAITFYAQPVTTEDLDVFVVLPSADSPIVLLTPVYSWLHEAGFEPHGEFVLIHGVPVQFLLAGTELGDEAIEAAITHSAEGTTVRVMTPEHLAALYLEAGTARRTSRTAHLIEQHAVDVKRLRRIIKRHRVPKRGLKI